jgi:phage-related protein
VSGVGSAVAIVVSGVGSAVENVVTPVASGLRSAALNAGQVIDAVADSVYPAAATASPLVSGAGNVFAGLGNTIGIAAAETTGLVPDLLDVTLDTVSDVLTNATLSLLTVSFLSSSGLPLLTLCSRLQFK